MKHKNCNEQLRVTLEGEKTSPTWKYLQIVPTSKIKWKKNFIGGIMVWLKYACSVPDYIKFTSLKDERTHQYQYSKYMNTCLSIT